MKNLTIFCMLAALASPALYAQSASPAPPSRGITRSDMGQSAFGRQEDGYRETQDRDRRSYKESQAKLTALRATLAKD